MSALNEVRSVLQARGATNLENYTMQVVRLESSGDPNARARTSSATGLFQFTEGTWGRIMPGVPFSQATNPRQSTEAFLRLTEENRGVLRRTLGREPEGWELYTAHFAGSGAAPRVLTAAEDAPLSGIFSERAMAANPHLGRLGTAGNYRRWVQERYNGNTTGVMNRLANAPAHAGGGNISGDRFSDNQTGAQAMQALQQHMQNGGGGIGEMLILLIMMILMGNNPQQAQAHVAPQQSDVSPPAATPPAPRQQTPAPAVG